MIDIPFIKIFPYSNFRVDKEIIYLEKLFRFSQNNNSVS